MKHEIEIEGLPEGWKAVAYRVPVDKIEHVLTDDGGIILTNNIRFPCLIVEKISPRRIVMEETGRWHINSTEGYVLVPSGSLIDMIDIEESQPDWMCYKVVEEE